MRKNSVKHFLKELLGSAFLTFMYMYSHEVRISPKVWQESAWLFFVNVCILCRVPSGVGGVSHLDGDNCSTNKIDHEKLSMEFLFLSF